MKIVDRYIVSSVLKTALATLFICSLLVLAVEMFSSMNNYVTSELPMEEILYLALLGLPEYIMMCASISFLFATTFFLSQLEGNNEMIMLLNSGVGYKRICLPIIVTALVVTGLFTLFSQTILIDATVEHDRLSVEYFGQTSTQDSSHITVGEIDGSIVVNARYFSIEQERLYNAVVIERSAEGGIAMRLEASYGDWEEGHWVFHEGRVYTLDGGNVEAVHFDTYPLTSLTIEPELFTAQGRSISTMDNTAAVDYLNRLRGVDTDSWYRAMTEYYARLFSALPIFVLVTISLLMNYRFKKNIFLFSIIQSLATAVVYYVVQMLVTIMCEQAMMEPEYSIAIPVAAVLALSIFIRLFGKVHG